MSVKIKLDMVYCTNSEADYPSFIVFEITRELFIKMKKIKKWIKKNNLTYAKGSYPFADIPFIYYENEKDILSNNESSTIIEANSIVMADSYFFISSAIRHTDCLLESNSLSYNYVEKLLNINELPVEHMAKYINDKDENIQNIAREKLEKRA